MSEQKISSSKRLGTMILDHFIMSMIAMVFFIPELISDFSNIFKETHGQVSPAVLHNINYLGLFGLALYFCKDSINGQSISKRILKLQLIDCKTGQIATPFKCFIRNVFCILWPIEIVVALINPNRRIGDRVAGTKLVPIDLTLERSKPNITQIAIVLGVAYGIMICIALPFSTLYSKFEGQKINFVEDSFNKQESNLLTKLFADSLGGKLSTDVKVYDKIQNENLKYVSVIFRLKENYMKDDNDFEILKSSTIPLLLTMFPEKTFVGHIEYIYQTNGFMQTRSLSLDWRIKR